MFSFLKGTHALGRYFLGNQALLIDLRLIPELLYAYQLDLDSVKESIVVSWERHVPTSLLAIPELFCKIWHFFSIFL